MDKTLIKNAHAIETGVFKPKEGITEEQLLGVFEKMFDEFLSKENGFLGHKLMKVENGFYMDIVFATTNEDNLRICDMYMKTESGKKFVSMLDESTVKMNFWKEVKGK